jgi:hypothetical protein
MSNFNGYVSLPTDLHTWRKVGCADAIIRVGSVPIPDTVTIVGTNR